MRKVIITGANGFVGTALCKELSNRGEIDIIAVVRNLNVDVSQLESIAGVRIIACESAEYDRLPDIIGESGIDCLYHFAWEGSAGPLRGNLDVQLSNIKYACDLIKACATMQCTRFVFAASIMEYEIGALMETNMTPGVNTLYSSAKLSADYILRTLAGELKIDYIRAIISNIYGPGEISARLINTSLRKMMQGEHCSFSEGNQKYDFIYITDAAKIFAELGVKGRNNVTYYIGSLNPRPLKEFLIEMRDQVDPRINIGLGDIKFTGVTLEYNEFDIYAVKNDTGYTPEVPFAEGIRKTIEWIREKDFNGF